MLLRCHECHALFSLQDGVAGTAGSFRVECGRCRNIFEASAPQRGKQQQQPVTPARSATEPGALERSATADALAFILKPLRPGEEPTPPLRRKRRSWPWFAGAMALGVVAIFATCVRRVLLPAP